MTEPAKTVVRREVLVDADLGTAQWTFEPEHLDLGDDQTIAQWIDEQKEAGETAYDAAKDLDLFGDVTIYFQVVEHYDDGTTACVERIQWETEKGAS